MTDTANETSRSSQAMTVDLSKENVHWDLRKSMSYTDYLHLNPLLSSQHPLTDQHDEMVFIVIHQASELWMKLCLHELEGAMAAITRDELGAAFKMMSRIGKIQVNLIQSWEILSTMTPFDYASFRDALGKSSGFQSYQYRLLEFRLGNKHREMARVFGSHPDIAARVQNVLEEPSIYDLCLALLARRGFHIPPEKLERDFSRHYVPNSHVTEAWRQVYRDATKYWDLYELAEKLVDLEYRFHLWRFTHMKTVERIIGTKLGTGGTTGVNYLKKALDLTFYPELWAVRSEL